MRRSDMVALTGFTIITLMGFGFLSSRAYGVYFAQLEFQNWFVAAAGWCVATYGPVLAAISLWRLAKQSRIPWLVHLLLLPALYGLLIVGNRLMLDTQYLPDFDATLGAPIMPALLTIVVTAMTYYLSLAIMRAARFRPKPNGS